MIISNLRIVLYFVNLWIMSVVTSHDCLSNEAKRCLPGWTNSQNACTTDEL